MAKTMNQEDRFIKVTRREICTFRDVGDGPALTWQALRSLAGFQGKTYVTITQLAEMRGASKRSVTTWLTALEEAGWIQVDRDQRTICYYPVQNLPTKQNLLPPWMENEEDFAANHADSSTSHADSATTHAMPTSNPMPIDIRSLDKREEVANAPWGDEDREKADKRHKAVINGIRLIESLVRETYGFPHPSSKNVVETEASPQPLFVRFGDALRGNAPAACLNNEFVKRQLALFTEITDPVRRADILEINKFYPDPSKPGGWGMKDFA